MELVISKILGTGYWGLNGWYYVKVVIIYHEVHSFIHSGFKNRPNWAIKWRSRGDNHPFPH